MGSRRAYPTAELYEERERDFYLADRSHHDDYEEFDYELTRGRPRSDFSARRSHPDFLNDDYGQTTSGPLVLPERSRSVMPDDDYPPPPRVRKEYIEREEVRIKKPDRGPPREIEREEVIYRRDPPPPRDADYVVKQRRTSSVSRGPHPREVEREEIIIDRRRPAPPPPDVEEVYIRERRSPPPKREEIHFRRGSSRPPPSEPEREEIHIRRTEKYGSEVEKEHVKIRRRRSPSPPRSMPPPLVREKEEFVIRRCAPRPPSPPSPPPVREREEIIIRKTERLPSPSPPPSPHAPPPPDPFIRPPIVQEIITHHRHIDHGVEKAKPPTPPPPPPSPPPVKEEKSIVVKKKKVYDDEIIYQKETKKEPKVELVHRHRSVSMPKPADWDLETEAQYYHRKAFERAALGEAKDGATKDWGLVDVPPGTNKVRMEGIGGGAQEITWQRYNGARRSKFFADGKEFVSDYGPVPPALPPPPKPKPADMWTEITKDLVLKEAIEAMKYDYEETENYFYVMEYLRYEDVLQLVEISDDIRRDRRKRIREIEVERTTVERTVERKPSLPPPPREYDYVEREVVYEDRRGRYR